MGGTGGSRWKVQEGGGIGIHIADLLHCTVQTNTVLKSNYIPIKKKTYRQAKIKRAYHHQTSFTTNVKGTPLGEKEKAITRNKKIMK